jgi:hypothetical protein
MHDGRFRVDILHRHVCKPQEYTESMFLSRAIMQGHKDRLAAMQCINWMPDSLMTHMACTSTNYNYCTAYAPMGL